MPIRLRSTSSEATVTANGNGVTHTAPATAVAQESSNGSTSHLNRLLTANERRWHQRYDQQLQQLEQLQQRFLDAAAPIESAPGSPRRRVRSLGEETEAGEGVEEGNGNFYQLEAVIITAFLVGGFCGFVCYLMFFQNAGSSGTVAQSNIHIQQQQQQLYSAQSIAEWIKTNQAETSLRETSPMSDEHLTPTMKMLWQTPIYRVNIGVAGVHRQKFNEKLRRLILGAYTPFRQGKNDGNIETGEEAKNPNQLFYEWQASTNWNLLRSSKDMAGLLSFIQNQADIFLQVIGQDAQFISGRNRTDFELWATVTHHGQSHMPHTHPNQMLSAVYYVHMPPRSGRIIFEDPRGPRPPFDNRVVIEPHAGDLLLFPSSLVHMVSPTLGSEERISIAVNLGGDWAATASIENEFPVDLK